MRPRTFQSRWRRSSPGVYSRCSTNSTENPCRVLRFFPLRKPSTTRRAVISSRDRRAISSESKNPSRRGIEVLVVAEGRGLEEEARDEVVGAEARRFRVEAGDQAVAQHRQRHVADGGAGHGEGAGEE